MIGYWVKAGDTHVFDVFHPYKEEFNQIILSRVREKKYGKGLDLLLIEYNLEGRFLKIPDQRFKVNYYRKKELSTSVTIYVPLSFENLSEFEKRKFIADTTIEAIRLVMKKMSKSKVVEINFLQLIQDLTECSKIYLQSNN